MNICILVDHAICDKVQIQLGILNYETSEPISKPACVARV